MMRYFILLAFMAVLVLTSLSGSGENTARAETPSDMPEVYGPFANSCGGGTCGSCGMGAAESQYKKKEKPVLSDLTPVTFEKVVNGSTFIGNGREIKLWGIKAPADNAESETGMAPSAMLKILLRMPRLGCQTIADDNKINAMRCYTNGNDVGGMMVLSGFAYDDEEASEGYYLAEQDRAKSSAQGLWANETPVSERPESVLANRPKE